MNEKYEIKGIEKIIEKVGKKQLAEYYQVGEDADFKSLIMESLEYRKVPNGLEIASYETINYEDEYKLAGNSKYNMEELYEKIAEEEGKALVGINFNIAGQELSDLYFYIDKPIKTELLQQMNANKFIGGASVHGYTMREWIL